MRHFFDLVLPRQGYKAVAAGEGRPDQHHRAQDHGELVRVAEHQTALGRDVYFACASFERPSYRDDTGRERFRTRENAMLARAFWLDIDVGKGDRQSYPDQRTALEQLRAFCRRHALPLPMPVSSGYGVHCYWPLDEDVAKADWLPVARQLKMLTQNPVDPLLADPSRTADIASLLRPVGTRNFKRGGVGVPVTCLKSVIPVAFAEFRSAILAAHSRLPVNVPAAGGQGIGASAPVSQKALEELLAQIDPDTAGRSAWWGKIAAIADALGEEGRETARKWSRGDLQVRPSSDFDPVEFERQYTDALSRASYAGNRVTVASIVAEARQAGCNGLADTAPEWLREMNEAYAWIARDRAIYRIAFGDYTTPRHLRDHHANRFVEFASGGRIKTRSIADAWMTHPDRREHDHLVFVPNGPPILPGNRLNTWRGFAVAGQTGSVQPFRDLLRRLIADPVAEQYVIMWMAHLIQHPEVKMATALVIWSTPEGVGKNLLFECLISIIGEQHSTLIGQAELARDFNGWARDKVLVIGDEVVGDDRRQHADKLKGLITGSTIQINEKHQPAVVVANLMNFIFLSNHPNAVFMGHRDRRYFVWEVEAAPLTDQEADAFAAWREGGGLGALRHMLESVSLQSFNPKARPPTTTAKQQMVSANRSDFELWAEQIIASGARNFLGREVATALELADYYANSTGRRRPSAKTVTGTFKQLGAYPRPHQIRIGTTKVRAIALDHAEHWQQQSAGAWATELVKPLQWTQLAGLQSPHVRLMCPPSQDVDFPSDSHVEAA